MSRLIRLTRLHALNWYGYHDSFDITGNLLIAGVTGSGKSVLMDLIQFVLIAHQAKVRYNLSATGDRSTRELKGYCLGDTKQDIDGVPQFMRNGGVTYVALEFSWPSSRKPRTETWGMRIEYENAAQANPSIRCFVIPGSLKRDDFLDPMRFPLDLPGFRNLVEHTVDTDGNPGRIFSGVEEYRREMALPSHLNFDRTTLDYLLPAAMSFTFMDSFSEFCRRHILPAESVDIQSVKDSYLVFRNLQVELGRLRAQFEQLERICQLDQERQEAEADRIACRYLEAECRWLHAAEQRDETAKRRSDLEQALTQETARLGELTGQIHTTREFIRSVEASFNASEDGKLYRRILQESQELTVRIEHLTSLGQSVEQARQIRIKQVRRWHELLTRLPAALDAAVLPPLLRAADRLATALPGDFRERTRELAAAVRTAFAVGGEIIRPITRRNDDLEREIHGLNAVLTALRAGTLTENTVLLTALNRQLPRRGKGPAAQALWQLCEVTDEAWRPALEVTFTRKHAVIVEPADYEQAERIYLELKENAREESLVNPQQALASATPPQPNSLALKLEVPSGNPIAIALIQHLFGQTICVSSVAALREHSRAITIDGFQSQRPFVERVRHYDHRPCIGQRGLEKQRAYLQAEIEQRRAEQRQLVPTLEAWRQVQQALEEYRLASDNLHDDLAETVQLPVLEARKASIRAELDRIQSGDLAAKERELEQAQQHLNLLQFESDGLKASPRRYELQSLTGRLTQLESELIGRTTRFNEVRDTEDVSAHLPKVDTLRKSMLGEFPRLDAAADRFQDRHQEARRLSEVRWAELVAQRRALAAHPDFGAKYGDFDPEAPSNRLYNERLYQIRGAQIREYEEKAATEERNWQELFREQVLEKLRERLLMVENLMDLLKTALDKPIGNNRYTIRASLNRDGEFDFYRRLLDISAVARDGSLFATADGDVRSGVERIFRSLTGDGVGRDAEQFLDYRNYFDYDILVTNDRDPEARPYSVNRQAGKSSGGENQTPYFIAILASYLRAYRRHETRRKEPSLAIVPIDEAFSKLSGERIRDCISALKHLELQGVFSMSTGNIPYAIDHCDQVIAVHKREQTKGRKTSIRNVAASLTRVEALERFGGGTR